MKNQTTGGCLCGAVRYSISGPLRDIVNCHCSKCRKFHGHFGAYTLASKKALHFTRDEGLKWFDSKTDETPGVQRGFCSCCGSSLFWYAGGRDNISITAGSLDTPIKLKTKGHIWTSRISDYYKIEDGLPQFKERWEES